MNKPFLHLIPLFALALLLSACSNTPKVNTDSDPTFNFSGIKTYYLVPHDSAAGAGEQGASLVDQRIGAALTKNMDGLGLKSVPKESAEVVVTYFVATDKKTRVMTSNNVHGYYGYRYGWGGGTNVDVSQYTEGTMVVDLVLPSEKRVLWRGTSSAVLKQRSTAERKELIDSVVAAIVAKMPAF